MEQINSDLISAWLHFRHLVSWPDYLLTEELGVTNAEEQRCPRGSVRRRAAAAARTDGSIEGGAAAGA
jgi:hypothetical protein